MTIGTTLKHIRNQQHRSQAEVAHGLCAQSMLSAIENDRYVPNAKLLFALCQRLNVELDQISLASDFAISTTAPLNQKLQRLCNQHRYVELKQLLLAPTTIAQITTDDQAQAYHYYLGVALFRTHQSAIDAQRHLQLAINLGMPATPSTLTRLSLSALAVIAADRADVKTAHHLIKQALTDLDRISYTENLNVLPYLAALVDFKLKRYANATRQVTAGITFVTNHQSHYMLANFYRLLAEIALKQDNRAVQLDAARKQRFLTGLFDEPVPEKF